MFARITIGFVQSDKLITFVYLSLCGNLHAGRILLTMRHVVKLNYIDVYRFSVLLDEASMENMSFIKRN